MAGAHLDSVVAGPGINDNGTGSAALLDVALELGRLPKVSNAVRFAWWGAEEFGPGRFRPSTSSSLTFEQQLDIALYLNFDMVGSPNAAYFVYDGDDSDADGRRPGPVRLRADREDLRRLLRRRRDRDRRHGLLRPLGLRRVHRRRHPGGRPVHRRRGHEDRHRRPSGAVTAGVAYDPCYHQACDNLGNIDRAALDRNLDAMAWTVGVYAYSTEDINGVPPRAQRLKLRSAAKNKMKLAENYVPSDKAA